MGYWGYFVVGRSERPLARTEALAGVPGLLSRTAAPGGWQVWEYPGAGAGIGSMRVLARETGAPALFGYVMDGACVAVEAAAPSGDAWSTCLVRNVMAGHLAGGDGGLGVDDYFLEPADAAGRAVAWAAEAGHAVTAGALLAVLEAEPGTGPDGRVTEPAEMAENLFFQLLDRLGVVPL
ncbi:hypothetical protein ACFYPT_15895 [Streptomyces sp. NPDC005529]|uniref:hypothetical protein n=1 Tax=unclassified Streptomyces TaxID=2593676 RepID=UPI0033A04951